ADVRALGPSGGPSAERRSAFSGRVVDEAGAPVAGARVEFLRNEDVPGFDVQASDGGVLARTASGPDGRFGLAVAESFARVVALGQRNGGARFALLRAAAPGLATAVVRVAPSGDGDTDVGNIVMMRGGGVRGRVVDPDGHPLGGAHVLCQHDD